VETIHVFVGVYRQQHRGFVDVLGQRELHQDAVYGGIAIQTLHQGNRSAWLVSREACAVGMETALFGLQTLVAHINPARRILADDHYRQAGRHARFRKQPLPGALHALNCGGRDSLSVDKPTCVRSIHSAFPRAGALLAPRSAGAPDTGQRRTAHVPTSLS
jgi:hypothetical protein